MPTLTYLLLFTMTIIDINFKEHCIFRELDHKTIPCSKDIIKTGYAHNTKCVKSYAVTICVILGQ